MFHLAAAVGVHLIVDHPLESLRTNIHGTEVVLDASLAAGRRPAVGVDQRDLREEHRGQPAGGLRPDPRVGR